jgi:DNA-binding transcriptional LysR family regulator
VTLEQLRIFVAVAEREHMTRAAEALGLVQSAVSAAIATLENQYDTPLFHRIGRRIELTDAGRLFLIEAKAVLARAAAAEQALADFAGGPRGSLSVHASQTIASYWLPRHLIHFRRAYPNVDVKVAIGNTAQVADAVLAGSADLGFVEGEIDAPTLSNQRITGDRLAIVVGMTHPWIEKRKVEIADLADADWVLREQGSGTRSEFEAELRRLGLDPAKLKVALELPSNEAVRSAVVAGGGVTAISELVVEALLRLGALYRIEIDLPARPFHVLHHRERYRSKASQALLDIIADDAPAR